MSEPTQIALQGHKFWLWLRNLDTYPTVPEIYVDRVQRVEPGVTIRQEKSHELGRKGPVGASDDVPDYRVTYETNWCKWEDGLYQAGKDPATATSFHLGDMVENSNITVYLTTLDENDAAYKELKLDGTTASELTMTWRMGGPITTRWTREAASGSILSGSSIVHTSRGTLDDSAPGSINPKDARLFLFTGSAPSPTDRVYRLQGIELSVRWPTQPVREIGRRDKVGVLSDVPDVTVNLDIQPADEQPLDRFFTKSGNSLLFNQPQTTNCLIRIYDPTASEATTVLGAVKIENLRPTSTTPIMAQVRGLATARITAEVTKENTTDSGGVVFYVGDMS